MKVVRTAAMLASVLAVPGCGGVTVLPTGPSPVTERVTSGDPTLLNFRGTLEDGGFFEGYIIYGTRDVDPRREYGRFQAGFWEVFVTGGTATHDAHFSYTTEGRAVLETYNSPFPAIGLVFLWPVGDPSLQALTPHFYSVPSYNPDQPPTLDDFGALVTGSQTERVGVFVDGQGGETLVSSVEFVPPIQIPSPRRPS